MKNIIVKTASIGLLLAASLATAQSALPTVNADGTPFTQEQLMQKMMGSYVEGSHTYDAVAWPLFVGAAQAGLCKDTVYRIGYSPRVVDAKLEEAYIGGTGRIPVVTVGYVVPQSPAGLAGLKEGDRILSANGTPLLTSGRNLSKKNVAILDAAAEQSAVSGTDMTLEVMQGSTPKQLRFKPVKSCNLTISSLPDAGRFNDTPDPTQVSISPSVMDQASDDVERQIVFAYAMSKNVSGSAQTKQTVGKMFKVLGTVSSLLPLAVPVDPSILGAVAGTEALANAGSAATNAIGRSGTAKDDKTALLILASVGINAQDVVDFWEKYMSSDANAVVYRWVNGSAMTEKRLNAIREVAAQEKSAQVQAPSGGNGG